MRMRGKFLRDQSEGDLPSEAAVGKKSATDGSLWKPQKEQAWEAWVSAKYRGTNSRLQPYLTS